MTLRQRFGNFMLFFGAIMAFVFVSSLVADDRYSVFLSFAGALALISFGLVLRFGGAQPARLTPTERPPAVSLGNLFAGLGRKKDKPDKK
ncbi:MAG TPA: hypothetical protein PK954_11645 [Anaerolineales bacterium]|nr:hypothetical protein [Anaerolineales bacterium]